ncbi:MAG: 4-(cytidine 5'-diphospho)-2-C-methyl-D-erythritol kinase [Bacteroidota bacterium]
MVVFPNAKINIGLNIIQRLPNGYHEIESCMYPIGWSDILEIIPSDHFSFEHSGLKIDDNPDQNLCVKAYRLLKDKYHLPPVSIYLHKIVPMGAGLGGGSSDAAFTLKVLNDLFELNISIEDLQKYASQLGSDCPFFIKNKPAIATGTGTDLQEIDLKLDSKYMVVIKPKVHSATASAYQGVDPRKPDLPLGELLSHPLKNWKSTVKNQFEETIGKRQAEIIQIKDRLYELGAVYSSMTGSGSAIYGFFDEKIEDIESALGLGTELEIWSEELKLTK